MKPGILHVITHPLWPGLLEITGLVLEIIINYYEGLIKAILLLGRGKGIFTGYL